MYAGGSSARRRALGDAGGGGSLPALSQSGACGVGLCRATMQHENGIIQVATSETRGGDEGTLDTVDAMRALIVDGSVNPIVRRQAVEIVRRVPPRDYDGQLSAIRQWVSRRTIFLRDPTAAELLHDPELMVTSILGNGRGTIHVDCDDVAILAGALGMSVGLLARIVIVSFTTSKPPARFFGLLDIPAPYEHVWVELASPIGLPRWADMDTTRQSQGVDPSLIERSLIIDL